MKFSTLELKPFSIDGSKIILTTPTVVFASDTRVIAEHTITEDQIGRMDLISLKYYTDENYVDFILKWNNISNPFILNIGDVIEIPYNKSALQTIIPVKILQISNINASNASIRNQFIDTKRLPIKDAKRIEYLQRKSTQKSNGSKQILPPNVLKEGENHISIGNGTIII